MKHSVRKYLGILLSIVFLAGLLPLGQIAAAEVSKHPIVVNGGKAYSDSARTNVITEAEEGAVFYIGYDEPGEGKYVAEIKMGSYTLDVMDYDGGLQMGKEPITVDVITGNRMSYLVDLTSGSTTIPANVYAYNHAWGSSGFPLPLGTKDLDLNGSGKTDVSITWAAADDPTASAVVHPDCDAISYIVVPTAETNTPYFEIIYMFTDDLILKFDANGHGTAPSDELVKLGDKPVKPKDPTASGWTFCGWYVDKECKTAFDFDRMLDANMTIYAKWIKDGSSPETGDDNQIGLLVGLLLLSVSALAWITISQKKKENI